MHFIKKGSFWTWLSVVFSALILLVAFIFDSELSNRAHEYTTINVHWYSLLPPFLAVSLCLILRRAILALSLSVIVGIMLVRGFNPVTLIKSAAVDYVYANLSAQFGFAFVGFVFSLLGMVSIITRDGGTQGVINIFKGMVNSARRACLATAAMGLAIFFDDYTNAIVIGNTMRNLTDALKVSREKLAFIVDATSAPVAGLAIVSTWIGFEVEQLQHVSDGLGLGLGGYGIFFQMIQFRYYCVFTIFFVLMNAILRRDFGPMLAAERRAASKGETFDREDDTMLTEDFSDSSIKPGVSCRWYNAVIPVATVVASVFLGIFIVGSYAPVMAGHDMKVCSLETWRLAFIGIGQIENAIPTVLCVGSTLGALVAAILAMSQGLLTFFETIKAWFHAWKIIFVITAFLLLAWIIRQICDELGTAYFLLAVTKGNVNPYLIPLVTFIAASMISFATGTSWGVMSILIPTMAPLAFKLGGLPIFIMTMASILDGAIFGDHCSPVSDTTILSSISSGCDHIDHVKTQIPYAILCMVVAGLAGYFMVARGYPVMLTYLIGMAAIVAFLFIVGRNPQKS